MASFQPPAFFQYNMIKAIVFDLGGVLVDLDINACVSAFLERIGFEKITEILDPFHQKGIYGEMEAGNITPDEFRAYVVANSRPGTRPEEVDQCMAALLVSMNPEKTVLLNSLAERYPLYILSNNNPISMKRSHECFEEAGLDWRNVFKEEFVSCWMKMLKPGSEIFNEVVRRIGVAPEEILFIDDSVNNVKGACAVGIKGVYYRQGDDLKKVIYNNLDK